MLTLQAYLHNPRTRRVLAQKPGDEGFSLIELVVVVAVLAILAAIAIPAFTSINDNAKQAAAKNTIAQIAKECAVKVANGDSSPTFNNPSIQGYVITPGTAGSTGSCSGDTNGEFVATVNPANAVIPQRIAYDVATGLKSCTVGSNTEWCQGSTW